MIAPSQGIHLVFDQSFLRGKTAVMVPHTSDGRVLFAIPWHNHTLVGTTDSSNREQVTYEPRFPSSRRLSSSSPPPANTSATPQNESDVLSVYVGNPPPRKGCRQR